MTRRARWTVALAGAAAAALLAGGCGQIPTGPLPGDPPASTGASDPSGPGPAPASPSGPPPVQLVPSVADKASAVTVDRFLSVAATGGRLTAVAVAYAGKDPKGREFAGKLTGAVAQDGSSWTATQRLEPSATYTVTMNGTNAAGATTTVSTFATQALPLNRLAFPTFYPLPRTTVGVGMPVILRFDVPITDRAAVEKRLKVTSSPAQVGSWHWYSAKEVHFRPKAYWKAGTTITARADLNSVATGGGTYGQNDATVQFTVGKSVVTKVDLESKSARVVIGGETARTIPISGGRKGWLTRSGTKVVLEKLRTTRMTAEMIGATEDYDLKVPYAMRVTWSGEFLHGAPWNAGNFGRRNTSHGCVGMSEADAKWLFERTQIGDPVETTGSNRELETSNGYTDWDLSWADYQEGSAL